MPVGDGTKHQGTFVADETWTAAASPHVLPYDMTIQAKITLEPCAVVQLAPGVTITVADGGSIDAMGTANSPIRIERLDPAAPWTAFRVFGGTMSLEHTTLLGGGDPGNAPLFAGALIVRATSTATSPEERVHLAHVSIEQSASQGLVLQNLGLLSADSTDLTITGSAGYPINAWANLAGSIPTGSYTGNATDEIAFPASGQGETIADDMTLHDRGVPYRVGFASTAGELRVGADKASVATLTIEPNVELRFKKGGAFIVEVFQSDAPASGALVAIGTPDKPIVMTSGEVPPKAGDWLGLSFGNRPDSKSRVENVTIQYAGGSSVTGSSSCPYSWDMNMPGIHDAGIRIFGAPPGQFIVSTTIIDSAGYGIDRGWRADDLTDFVASNTFTNLVRCKQTFPKDKNGACPANPPCP